MKQPTISNLQFTIINDCITTLCQSPWTLTKSTIPTPPTAPTAPTAPTPPILCPCGSHLPLLPPLPPTTHATRTSHHPFPASPPSGVRGHSSLIPRHLSFVSRHSSLVIRLSSFVPRHSSLGDFQSSSENSIDYTIFNNFFRLVPFQKFERHLSTFNT